MSRIKIMRQRNIDIKYLRNIICADSAQLRCLHDHDGVMIESFDDILMDYVLILSLKAKLFI
jgi:hypothetical protein